MFRENIFIPSNSEPEKPKIEPAVPKEKMLIGPALSYLEGVHDALLTGDDQQWKKIHHGVLEKPFKDVAELSERIRQAVCDYVATKIPTLKEKAPTLENLDNEGISNAIVNNWFEEVPEIEGQRREVLLAAASHMVKTIETHAYKQVIEKASDKDLSKLGLQRGSEYIDDISGEKKTIMGSAELLKELMETCLKSDTLFVRFLAFSQLTPEAPQEPHLEPDAEEVVERGQIKRREVRQEKISAASIMSQVSTEAITDHQIESQGATGIKIFRPKDYKPYTVATLFPTESQFLAKRFAKIANQENAWSAKPEGKLFTEYLLALSSLYGETDPEKAEMIQEEVKALYGQLAATDFPILITPAIESYFKEPYFDPDLSVSLASPETQALEGRFKQIQTGMADNLAEYGLSDRRQNMKDKVIKVVNKLGSYGSNLHMSAVAQEEPAIVMFLNEQKRAYDQSFDADLNKWIDGAKDLFGNLKGNDRKELIMFMSQGNTMMHELSHSPFDDNSPEAKRLGVNSLNDVAETMAESLYRGQIPELISQGVLQGSKEQWTAALLTSSLQLLRDQPPDDSYYKIACYTLNKAFDQGLISFNGKKVAIKENSADEFYRLQKESAKAVIGLYQDAQMTSEKASVWVEQNCQPNQAVTTLADFLKK